MSAINIKTTLNAPVEKVWKIWSSPEHIIKWSSASEDWHTPKADNDLRPGGRFSSRMEARDGSMGFDFNGTYDVVKPHEKIGYTLDDGRKVDIYFRGHGDTTDIDQTFEPESTHPEEMQRAGWQAILDNFKKYTESI
jgi:uncharacterized protein YndB with AHSA1/START domain